MATNQGKQMPKDAFVMQSILKDTGITEYEPRLVNVMLELVYKYVTNILDDARVYATHSKKKTIDNEDIKLAVQMKMNQIFSTPPPRDILMDVARVRNSNPLPLIKPLCGLNLPPDRYCLSSCNYQLKMKAKPQPVKQTNIASRLSMMSNKMSVGSPGVLTGIKAGSPGTFGNPTQTLTVVGKQGPVPKITTSTPKPIIKFSAGPSIVQQSRVVSGMPMTTTPFPSDMIKQEFMQQQGVKRKLETDYMLDM